MERSIREVWRVSRRVWGRGARRWCITRGIGSLIEECSEWLIAITWTGRKVELLTKGSSDCVRAVVSVLACASAALRGAMESWIRVLIVEMASVRSRLACSARMVSAVVEDARVAVMA